MQSPNRVVRLLIAALLLTGGGGALADGAREFRQCVADLQREARREGVSAGVVRSTLAEVEFVERVVELDRAQPEFTTTFDHYVDGRVTEQRVERGRELLAKHRELLRRVALDYGVAPRYLVAFWGMETNYGTYFGEMPTLDVLATLACDERRPAFFSEQLMAALRVVDAGAIPPERMRGSWAGAFGHVQFLPSVFERYAVDYDGDGERDLWNSVPDAMASAANYLASIGWKQGWRWGREVTLPDAFDYTLAGRGNERSLAEWRDLGVRTAYDRPLSGSEARAALIVPAGHEGPAFLVYDNFHVIMEWNRSELYALSVGHLADRLAGVSGLVNPPPDDRPRLATEAVAELQARLNARGYEAGPVDGIPGPSTRAAIRRFQAANGMVADGYPSREVLDALSLQLAEYP